MIKVFDCFSISVSVKKKILGCEEVNKLFNLLRKASQLFFVRCELRVHSGATYLAEKLNPA